MRERSSGFKFKIPLKLTEVRASPMFIGQIEKLELFCQNVKKDFPSDVFASLGKFSPELLDQENGRGMTKVIIKECNQKKL